MYQPRNIHTIVGEPFSYTFEHYLLELYINDHCDPTSPTSMAESLSKVEWLTPTQATVAAIKGGRRTQLSFDLAEPFEVWAEKVQKALA